MGKREVLVWALSSPENKTNSLIQHHGQLPAQPQETAAEPVVSKHDWEIINTGQIAFSGDFIHACVSLTVTYLTVNYKRPVWPFGNPNFGSVASLTKTKGFDLKDTEVVTFISSVLNLELQAQIVCAAFARFLTFPQ